MQIFQRNRQVGDHSDFGGGGPVLLNDYDDANKEGRCSDFYKCFQNPTLTQLNSMQLGLRIDTTVTGNPHHHTQTQNFQPLPDMLGS